jgi:vacuolar-type H+-ATPase subunit C/Vma6
MLGFFATKEQRTARALRRLTEKTIAKMDYLLSRRGLLDADKTIIEEHRKSRIEDLSKYRKFESGQVDELDRLRSYALRDDEMTAICMEAMNRELHRFSDSPAEFAAYLRAIVAWRDRRSSP